MEPQKLKRLVDLVQKIKKVDEMILLHSNNPSPTMRDQYEAKKLELMNQVIEELVRPETRSSMGLSVLGVFISRFYPQNEYVLHTNPDFSKLVSEMG